MWLYELMLISEEKRVIVLVVNYLIKISIV